MESKRKNAWEYAAIITIACYFIFIVSARIYVDTDNITIAVVTNGLYGEDNFCQHLHPLFCVLVRLLDTLIPTADMYTVLIHLLVFAEIYFLAYIAGDYLFESPFQSFKTWDISRYISAALLILGILFLSTFVNLWNVNYTVQTVSLMMTALLLFTFAQLKGKIWCKVAGTVLIGIAFMLRLKGAILFIPYILLEWSVQIIMSRKMWKTKVYELFRMYMPSLLLVVLLLSGQAVFNSFEPYKTAVRHNHFREIVVDFPMRDYDESDSAFNEIRKDEYDAAVKWVLCDTDVMTADKMEKFAHAGSTNEEYESLSAILASMFGNSFAKSMQHYIFLAISLLFFLGELFFVKDKWLRIEILLAFGGSFIILFYFTFRGRTPLRIWQSVLIAANAIFLEVVMKNRDIEIIDQRDSSNTKPVLQNYYLLLMCIILWFAIGQYFAVAEVHVPVTALTAKINADDSFYKCTYSETENGEASAVYLWPWWNATIPDYFSGINKLPTQRVIDHNIAIGDWVYGQPYFNNFLKKINCINPLKALLDRPNTYLIGGVESDIANYLLERYGEEISLEEKGMIGDWKIYQVIRKLEE